MGADRPVLLLHVLLVAFVLITPFAAADAAKPSGTVTVSGPDEVRLEGGEDTTFQLHISARLECARGFEPPRDIVVAPANPASEADGPLWRINPSTVTVPWVPSSAEPNVFVVDTDVTFNVTSDAEPTAPVESEAVIVLREVEGTKAELRCAVEGYDLKMESHEMSFLVVPSEDTETATAVSDEEPRVRWVPMVLALAILGALALFATVRERQRRRGA